MSTKMTIGAGLAVICLALPALSHAQGYRYRDYDRDYRPQAYGDSYRRPVRGYPEFRDREYRIQRLIQDGVRDDLIEREDARDLMGQLRAIQQDEQREFAVHGRNLPEDDRERIADRLARLDRLVDQIRDEE